MVGEGGGGGGVVPCPTFGDNGCRASVRNKQN